MLASLPLLQQSTRPSGWRQWFDEVGVDAPQALDGPRYELFSMLAVAATQGMGVALIPLMLIEDELSRGELVIASNNPLKGSRAYYLMTPLATDGAPVLAALEVFRAWLVGRAQA